MGGLGVTVFHLEVACILYPAVINYTKGGEGRVWLTARTGVVMCALQACSSEGSRAVVTLLASIASI